MPDSLTVVLPTLNEAGNIRRLAEGIWASVPDARILVCDDGSHDGTQERVRELARQEWPIRLIARSGRPCLTASIQDGVDAANTHWIAWMDADLSHPPELLPRLLAAAQAGGCAIATRFAEGAKPKSAAGSVSESVLAVALSNVLNFLVHRILRLTITDYTSGFIVIRRDLLLRHRLVGDYGEYFIELMYWLASQGVVVAEVPYESPPRQWGDSKTGPNLRTLVRRGTRYLWLTLRLVLPRRPFGALSLRTR